MAYSLRPPYKKFCDEINALTQIIQNISKNKSSIERNTHVEGCFIRFVVAWETFCEEYFLRCMCGGITRSNSTVRPKHSTQNSTSKAFTLINKSKKERHQDYVDWLDNAQLQDRINLYFRVNSRVQKLALAPDKMFEMKVIRNAIAHGSMSSLEKMKKFVKDQLGYLSKSNPSPAELLLMSRRNQPVSIFSALSNYFSNLAHELTK